MNVKHLALAVAVAGSGANAVFAAENAGTVFGNLRIGFIEADDENGENTGGSAIGGKLGYISPQWKGLSAGATFYATQKLFDNDNGDFFGSDNQSYAIAGEAFIQGDFANTMIKAGRFEFDSPHADTDDIRMIPNTFQGVLLTNKDLPDTTFYLSYLDKWAGVDADVPEEFKDMNGDNGIAIVGASYEGLSNTALQAWYYYGDDFARLLYLEAVYETDLFGVGAQYGSQSDDTPDDSGPDGDVYGVFGSVTVADFMLMAAFNDVSGTVTNGFGGGPFFTSADDHTIDGVKNQRATAVSLEYSGIDGLTLGIWHTRFDKGADETDWYAVYEYNDSLGFELIYTDMHDDGDFVRLMANYYF